MKVALLGAPGSGKTVFAKKLATSMARADGFKRPKIIDGYVEDLQDKTGYQLDIGATYPQNFQIHFHRWTQEQAIEHKGYDSITCGTIYETFIYSVLHSNMIEESQEDSLLDLLQMKSALTALGMIEVLTYNYQALFYLPLSDEVRLAHGKSYDTVVDRKIPEVLEGYQKNYVILDGTERANVKYATKIINALRAAPDPAADHDEQSVRGSGEDPGGESPGS